MAILKKTAIILWYHAQVLFAVITTVAIVDGNDCRFIIENYQEVLCNRTKTMSKPTYYAKSVIAQMDRWYEDSWKPVYKCSPIGKNAKKLDPDLLGLDFYMFPADK